jgi:DNA-binding PadR family transcriptional regulator
MAIAHERAVRGEKAFHGYELTKLVRERIGEETAVGHAGIYKALERLERAGVLASKWEELPLDQRPQRPPRRIYWLTGLGSSSRAPVAAATRVAGRSAGAKPLPNLEVKRMR